MTGREHYFTFGFRYRTETHPTWPEAHPDGWLTIVADGPDIARGVALALLGHDWAFQYSEADPPRLKFFPRGELRRIDVSSHSPSAA